MSRSNERRERNDRNQQSVQDTHLRVSGNSAESDSSNNSGSSYSEFQGVPNEPQTDYEDDNNEDEDSSNSDYQGVPNEPPIDYEDDNNEDQERGFQLPTDCYIPRGCRYNYTTFWGEPSQYDNSGPFAHNGNAWQNSSGIGGSPSSSQSEGSDSTNSSNSSSQYDNSRPCAHNGNAWNSSGIGDFHSSSQSEGSDSTNSSHSSSYENVQSAQSSPRNTESTSPPPERPPYINFDMESDQSIQKHKSCSIKKICKRAIWTAIFLSISLGVALSTFNNVNTSELEEQMIQGDNAINTTFTRSLKMVGDSLKEAIMSGRNGSQTFSNETSFLRNKTESSIREMKTVLSELFEELKRNITSYWMNKQNSGSGLGSGSDPGGKCYNSTTGGCVDQCHSMCDGDYQSCWTCKGYVTCANRILWSRNCSDSHLVWDDNAKRCESESNTCE